LIDGANRFDIVLRPSEATLSNNWDRCCSVDVVSNHHERVKSLDGVLSLRGEGYFDFNVTFTNDFSLFWRDREKSLVVAFDTYAWDLQHSVRSSSDVEMFRPFIKTTRAARETREGQTRVRLPVVHFSPRPSFLDFRDVPLALPEVVFVVRVELVGTVVAVHPFAEEAA